MPLRMWTYDLAREQVPTLDHLRRFCDLTLESGYDAIGLYLEHRFAYPSVPWVHGKGCLTPEMVQALQSEYKTLQIIPFINLLGHFEGFLYAEAGVPNAESKFRGMQACPSKPNFVELANQILQDTLDVFSSQIVHIGGDETFQLGSCPECKRRVAEYEQKIGVDGKAKLYGEHFGAGTIPVAIEGNSPQPEPRYPVGFAHPKVLAGSPTYPLDVIAGLSPDRRSLRIAVVNATFKAQSFEINLGGLQTRAGGKLWRLSGKNLEAANKVGQPPGVSIREEKAPALSRGLTVPPISTSIYEFPLRQAVN